MTEETIVEFLNVGAGIAYGGCIVSLIGWIWSPYDFIWPKILATLCIAYVLLKALVKEHRKQTKVTK